MTEPAPDASLLEIWTANGAINGLLLGTIPDEAMEAVPLLKGGKPGRGRDVARVFIHLHNVRLYHLEALAKALAAGLPKFGKGETASRADIAGALAASADAVAQHVEQAMDAGKLIRKRHPAILLAYLISHESHHRGQIMLALKQNGIRVADDLKWGLWTKWFKD